MLLLVHYSTRSGIAVVNLCQPSLQGISNGVLASADAYDPFITTPASLVTPGSVTHQV